MLIRKTASREDFEAVWRLTHDIHVAEGYASPHPSGILRHYPYLDASQDTTILMAESVEGELLGSISFTVDGPAGLPVDKHFKKVVERLRRRGERLGAAWRIVTRPGSEDPLAILVALINDTLLVARDLAEVSMFTFAPKYESFYKRVLGLETIAGPRDSHAAPAILMAGSIREMQERWEMLAWRRTSVRRLATEVLA